MTSTALASIDLDRQRPVPLYFQFAATIRPKIQAGTLEPGQQLPAERDLAREAGISRMTARQALADLAHSGDVVVRHGIGTFVAMPELTHDAVHLLGFTEEMESLGGDVASRGLECEAIRPPPGVREALRLGKDGLVNRIAPTLHRLGPAAAGDKLHPLWQLALLEMSPPLSMMRL